MSQEDLIGKDTVLSSVCGCQASSEKYRKWFLRVKKFFVTYKGK